MTEQINENTESIVAQSISPEQLESWLAEDVEEMPGDWPYPQTAWKTLRSVLGQAGELQANYFLKGLEAIRKAESEPIIERGERTAPTNGEGRQVLSEVVESLPCQLTRDEFVDKAEQLARMMHKRDDVEEDMKSSQAHFKSRLKEIDKEVGRLRDIVEDRRENRQVRCITLAIFSENRVEKIRTDTSEVIFSRPLEEHERQKFLFDQEEEREEQQDEGEEVLEGKDLPAAGEPPDDWPGSLDEWDHYCELLGESKAGAAEFLEELGYQAESAEEKEPNKE